MQISDLAELIRDIDAPSASPLLKTLGETLDALVEIARD